MDDIIIVVIGKLAWERSIHKLVDGNSINKITTVPYFDRSVQFEHLLKFIENRFVAGVHLIDSSVFVSDVLIYLFG
jgi:hypothetical protein